jgi:glycosyltransferase involved in cell wall biosynthesis
MPRVAMVIQRYLPHLGGTERQLQQVAPRLQSLGYEVSILTRHEKGLLRYEVIDGIPVYRLPSPGPKRLAGAIFTIAAVTQLIRLHPDLVHAYEILTPASIATLSKRISKHAVLVKILRGGERGDVYKLKRRPFWKSYFQNLIRHVDAFLVISNEIDDELSSLGVPSEKRIFLPNGVNTERCIPLSTEEKLKLRAKLSLPLHETIVIYVGRLVPEKRVDLLLKIWNDVRQKHSGACLLIVGEGSEAQRLRAMRVDGVQFTGQVNDAVSYLQSADLFVLPSSTEGLSNSMLEAMSCSLPVLASSVGGAPDVIEQNVSGFLIAPDDENTLRAGLKNLLEDEALRFRLGSNARVRILLDFSLDSVAQRLADLYGRLLKNNNATD